MPTSNQLVTRLIPTAKLHIKADSELEQDRRKSPLASLWRTKSVQIAERSTQHSAS